MQDQDIGFIGRSEELKALEDAYQSHSFELVTVIGPAGSGKTALLREFCRNKRAVLFTASRTNQAMNLAAFSKAASKAMYRGLRSLVSFNSVPEAFLFMKRLSANGRLIVVVDGYDALRDAVPGADKDLKNLFEHDLEGTDLMVVLSGRSVIDPGIADHRSIRLERLPFSVLRDVFLDSYDDSDLVRLYAITGGNPGYIRMIDRNRTVNQNVDSMFFSPDSPLYKGPLNDLMTGVRSSEKYECILSVLSDGPKQMGEIVDASGVSPSSACSTYISTLMDLGLVKKSLPYGEKASRKGVYSISDPSLLFWFRFVHGNRSLIDYRYSEDLYGIIVGEDDGYLPAVFREVCLQFILENPAYFDMTATRTGEWWGEKGHIDIVAGDLLTTMFCDCRYRDSPVGLSVLEGLKDKAKSIRTIGSKRYAVFSKEGFAKDLLDYAKRHSDVTLVSLRDICGF